VGDRRSKLAGSGLASRVFYVVVRSLVVAWCRVWLRLRVHGRDNLPRTGPYVLAPTHRSNLDIPAAAAVSTRRLRYMGKDTLWKYRPVGAMFSALGGFPVVRGTADLEALKRCVEVLRRGEPLVLFPEGTRRSGPFVSDLFDGAAFVAVKAGVPIVPVAIAGTEESMGKGRRGISRGRCVMVIGAPLRETIFDGNRASREELAEITGRLQERLQVLLNDANAKMARRTAGRQRTK
jgi:1-acyl-sn-glycerol-3-phosphate acyltransferase